jgi:hypothetical protein
MGVADAVLGAFDDKFPAAKKAVPEKMPVKKPAPDYREPWYNWSKAPDGAFLALVDRNHVPHWCCFIAKEGDWRVLWRRIPDSDFFINGCPWDKSLRQRPGKEV